MKSDPTKQSLARVCVPFLLAALMSCLSCYAENVVFLRATSSPSVDEQPLNIAAAFYGFTVQTLIASAGTDAAPVKNAITQKTTLAVVIAADALPALDRKAILSAARRGAASSIPVLISGATTNTDVAALGAWSGGAIAGVRRLDGGTYAFGHIEGLTAELSGVETPLHTGETFSFVLDKTQRAERISRVKEGQQDLPVFIDVTVDSSRVFIASKVPGSNAMAAPWDEREMLAALPSMAPSLLFLKYSGGEHAWHSPGRYANLTIDDAWLRQPYGYLDYNGLLKEMGEHNFHSTIAFIPWNYDRSQPAVVSIFRNHPERFSICVHGDNHDHKEFTDYRTKSLALQTHALKQSLARMEKFQELTGIPYDKVMVFPHSIAPEMTLAGLKTYNYLATANSRNVPMESAQPAGLSFALRPTTLAFQNFPSITRYSVEGPLSTGFIAMNAFLDNPLLFYCHQPFFSNGIGAFDNVADEVNRLDPGTHWTGLGEIARHLYELRLRDDSDYDVLSSSSDISLDNTSARELTYYVTKPESGVPAIASVRIDGQGSPYRVQDGHLEVRVAVPAGQSRHLSIEYANDFAAATTDISKDSALVYALRMASDFRDINLSRFGLGSWFVRYYYAHDMTPTQAVLLGVAMIISCLLCVFGLWHIVVRFSWGGREGINPGVR